MAVQRRQADSQHPNFQRAETGQVHGKFCRNMSSNAIQKFKQIIPEQLPPYAADLFLPIPERASWEEGFFKVMVVSQRFWMATSKNGDNLTIPVSTIIFQKGSTTT